MAVAFSTLILIPILLPFLGAVIIFGFRKWLKSFSGEIATAIIIVVVSFIGAMITRVKNATNQILYGFYYTADGTQYNAPLGVQFRADGISSWFILFINIILILLFIYISTKRRDQQESPIFTAIMLLLVSGINGTILANDFFTLFLSWVIIGLATVILVIFKKEGKGLEQGAARIYIVVGLSLSFQLIALVLCYGIFGTLNFDYVYSNTEFHSTASQQRNLMIIYLIIALVIIAYGLLAQLFLLNLWIPNALEYAPISVRFTTSGIINSLAVISILRILYSFFNPIYYSEIQYPIILAIIGLITAFEGIMLTIHQFLKKSEEKASISKILFYIALSNVGLILTTLSFQGIYIQEIATNVFIKNIIGYSFIQMINLAVSLFMLFISFERFCNWRENTDDLNKLKGVGKERPLTAISFIVAILSFAGIIPTFGGIPKFMLLISLIQTENIAITVFYIMASVLLLIISLWLIKIIMFDKTPSARIYSGNPSDDISLTTFTTILLSILLILFGFIPSIMVNGIINGVLSIFS